MAIGLWRQFWCGYGVMALYLEKVPVQSSLSLDQPLLRLWHDRRLASLRREHPLLAVDWLDSCSVGVFPNHEMR